MKTYNNGYLQSSGRSSADILVKQNQAVLNIAKCLDMVRQRLIGIEQLLNNLQDTHTPKVIEVPTEEHYISKRRLKGILYKLKLSNAQSTDEVIEKVFQQADL